MIQQKAASRKIFRLAAALMANYACIWSKFSRYKRIPHHAVAMPPDFAGE